MPCRWLLYDPDYRETLWEVTQSLDNTQCVPSVNASSSSITMKRRDLFVSILLSWPGLECAFNSKHRIVESPDNCTFRNQWLPLTSSASSHKTWLPRTNKGRMNWREAAKERKRGFRGNTFLLWISRPTERTMWKETDFPRSTTRKMVRGNCGARLFSLLRFTALSSIGTSLPNYISFNMCSLSISAIVQKRENKMLRNQFSHKIIIHFWNYCIMDEWSEIKNVL